MHLKRGLQLQMLEDESKNLRCGAGAGCQGRVSVPLSRIGRAVSCNGLSRTGGGGVKRQSISSLTLLASALFCIETGFLFTI